MQLQKSLVCFFPPFGGLLKDPFTEILLAVVHLSEALT